MAMTPQPQNEMGRRRGLLTEHEREMISDEDPEKPNRRYLAISRVRTKIQDEFPRDVEILAAHHPELLEELREVVCPSNTGGEDAEPAAPESSDD